MGKDTHTTSSTTPASTISANPLSRTDTRVEIPGYPTIVSIGLKTIGDNRHTKAFAESLRSKHPSAYKLLDFSVSELPYDHEEVNLNPATYDGDRETIRQEAAESKKGRTDMDDYNGWFFDHTVSRVDTWLEGMRVHRRSQKRTATKDSGYCGSDRESVGSGGRFSQVTQDGMSTARDAD
jgi:hypothetical protein